MHLPITQATASITFQKW